MITVTFYGIFMINQHCVDFNSGVGELHSPRLQPIKENRERVEMMEIIVGILKQKILWIGLAVMILFASVLTIALLGSTINAELKGAPMALVLQDEGVALQSGVELNFGQKIVESVMTSIGGQDNSAFKWTILTDKSEAMDAMNDQKYYGALIIPKDFSKKVMSVTSANQTPGEVEVYVNNGMSQTVANILTQVVGKMETGINDKLRTQLAAQLASATKQTPEIGQSPSKQTSQTASAQAAAMQAQRQMMQNLQQNTLVSFTIDKVNVIPDHSANGNAPVSVTMLAWMTGLISSILLFFVIKKVEQTKKTEKALTIGIQIVCAIAFCFIASLVILIVGNGLLKMTVPNSFEFCLYFTLISFSFFLMQSMLVNGLGAQGIVLVMLVFFFGLPMISLPYEMLSSASKFWLYSWMPLRFGVEVMRDFFYFAGTNMIKPMTSLLSAGAICLVLSFLSVFMPVKKSKTSNLGF
ncbi:hypothetical protein A7K50_08095 [Dehalobacter sp. MCB1]|uniref:YhgE/Pip domain-containing protein n=2 Tax=Dehalobacter TaxID=56112 RepID=UPI0003A2B54B|nr:ABC transporter permease [Dehalobacter sp. MCB1]RJE49063.1 hypothetical protein A7K50_08095 [Dehalobacter sp. MCB1]TCX51802.1 DUF3533 domain-containing protein [Dehalobacter sp. 14DCB1]TCX52862.1 DUF3533 domain-containing protein [Dehalobacter sp. 12DCB1]